MALGKRSDEQQEMWVATTSLPKSEGHVFYRKLNQLLAEADFDRTVEKMCRALLPQPHRPPVDSAGRLLSHAAGRLLRGHRLATGHCLALWRQPFAAGVPGHPADRRDARPFQPDAGPRPPAAGGPCGRVPVGAEAGGREGAAARARRWPSIPPRWRPTRP